MFCYMKIICGLFLLLIAPAITTFKTTSPSSVKAPRVSIEPACRGKEPGKFVKDPYACDKFYYCGSDETAIVVDCPLGMIFNDEKEICDFPSNYLCVPRIEEEEEGVSTTKISTTLPTQKVIEESSSTTSSKLQTTPPTVSATTTRTTTTKKTTKTTASTAVERNCPLNDSKTLIFLRHPYECHRYYICYHGVPIAQECISELHWNPLTNRCDFPENSGCFVPTVVVPQTSTAVSVTEMMMSCPFRGEQIFPHPNNCNYFIYCINGYGTVQQCPFYNHFDIRTRRCLWKTMATCIIKKK